jgi:hypothetical protein
MLDSEAAITFTPTLTTRCFTPPVALFTAYDILFLLVTRLMMTIIYLFVSSFYLFIIAMQNQVAPANIPGGSPTEAVTWGGTGQNGFLGQSSYAKFWVFGPNSYLFLSESNRIYQFTSIPTSTTISLTNVNYNTFQIGSITPSSKIVGVAHATRTTSGFTAFGTLAVATESNIIAFTRQESNPSQPQGSGTAWSTLGTRAYPQCGGSPCFRGTQASLVRTFPGDSFQTIIFGTTTGRIISFSADDSTTILNGAGSGVFTAGAGSIAAIEHLRENDIDYLYIASSSGFIFQFDWSGRRIASLVLFQPLVGGVFQNVEITALSVDTTTRVLYFGAGDGDRETHVGRINLGRTDVSFDVLDSYRFDSIVVAGTNWTFGRVKALYPYHPGNTLAVLTEQPFPAVPTPPTAAVGTRIFLPSIVSCSQYNCSDCGVTDANLWCVVHASPVVYRFSILISFFFFE